MKRDSLLAQVINECVQRKYGGSAARLSEDADLSKNTVSNILRSGRADPKSLKALSPKLGIPLAELFVLAGRLTPQDIRGEDALEPDERELLDVYRSVAPEHRPILLQAAVGARQGLRLYEESMARRSVAAAG